MSKKLVFSQNSFAGAIVSYTKILKNFNQCQKI